MIDNLKNISMINNRVACPDGGYPEHEARYTCSECKRSTDGLTCLDPECLGFILKEET